MALGSPGPEGGEAWPAWGTPARVWLCGCWVHASGISAWLPGLLLGGEEQEEELHIGKLLGGPCFFRGSPPPREGQGAPWFPGKNPALSPAACCPQQQGSWWPPLTPLPPTVSGPSTPEDSFFQQPSVCSEPHPATQAAPSPQEVFPNSPLTCPLSRRPLKSSLLDGGTLSTALSSVAHSRCARNSC